MNEEAWTCPSCKQEPCFFQSLFMEKKGITNVHTKQRCKGWFPKFETGLITIITHEWSFVLDYIKIFQNN